MVSFYTISNENITVVINSKGGELWSFKDAKNAEYLWQGGEKYWKDRAINLFPYIARLTDGTYKLFGKEYKMDIHGFLKDTQLVMVKQEKECVVLKMCDSKETYIQYPYHFELEIMYSLKNKELEITYFVKNKDEKTMYFGIGGHPGFNIPFEQGGAFEDYYIQFNQKINPLRINMSESCFVLDGTERLQLDINNKLLLNHKLFDKDAIILKEMGNKVQLESKKGQKKVTVEFLQMKYLGIWHVPKTDAPYICIEPWTSLPSREGIVESLEEQGDLIVLKAKKIYKNRWKISIN